MSWEKEVNEAVNKIRSMSDEEFVKTCRDFGYDPLPGVELSDLSKKKVINFGTNRNPVKNHDPKPYCETIDGKKEDSNPFNGMI